jgi:fructose-bisphosphate aldolase class II
MLVNLDYVLKDAQKNGYAVGLFNTIDTDMLEAVISVAEELRSPVIIGTAEILLPYGELKLIAPSIIDYAKRASVPVVVHYDHGLTEERCIEAMDLGFTSIMFDGSTGDINDNIARTKKMVELAHKKGVTVEGEIGHVGEADNNDGAVTDMYTTPKEALDFIAKTGVDALAVAIGTAHGAYKSKPKLDIDRLKQIKNQVDVPLVLHGGSGLSDDDFKNTIANGIAKINIFTDMCVAGLDAMRNADGNYLQVRNQKVEAIKKVVKNKILLFGSNNRY